MNFKLRGEIEVYERGSKDRHVLVTDKIWKRSNLLAL